MNTLDRALIEKAACEHGWENVLESQASAIVLASARHRATARIVPCATGPGWWIEVPAGLIRQELARSLPGAVGQESVMAADDIDDLSRILRRTAELAMSLPNQAALTYREAVSRELKKSRVNATEVERLVKQRIGQETFRQALMDYWGGACAVTGIDLPEVLRASHAKPWAACESDEERLNVFNGFLLTAHLDALFDRGLITFADSGLMLCSPRISNDQQYALHLDKRLALRWLSQEHQPYLAWHRKNVFFAAK
ncbi:MAG: restriction endonuclease [Desulfobulbaceae bacterium DB1]|nr:MAG: restriction endonuclease [Desulfobulbaceae bacterium DB1]